MTAGLGITTSFAEPFYTGSAALASATVPGLYPIAVAGHPYLLDGKSNAHKHETIPFLRQQYYAGTNPDESSISPEGLWRRSRNSWENGAGQVYFDRHDSDSSRFRSSKGMYVWERGEVSLLNDTRRVRTSANTNVRGLPVGPYYYLADGNSLIFTADITAGTPTFTDSVIAAGESATPVQSIATDGYNVWAALGANGIHTTTRAAVSSTHYSDLACTLVAFINNRLMAANNNLIYNVIAAGAAPVALNASFANTDFRWVGFASGSTHIYAAGFAGDKSSIYKIAIKPDGTALDAPTHALPGLPDGEIVTSIDSYLGFVLIGTNKGWRLAKPDSAGNLTVGFLVSTPAPVYAFEGQDRFVWYGWSNYDSASTGLGRMDTGSLPDGVTPAWASDLMATAQGSVLSISTFQNIRVFTVSGSGVWIEDTTSRVASGTLDWGYISYGITDPKIALFYDTRYRVLIGSHQAYLATADRVFNLIGTHSPTTSADQFPTGQVRSEIFELRDVLTRDATDHSKTPVLIRATLKSEPAVDVGEYIFAPVLLAESLKLSNGSPAYQDVAAELAYLKGLRRDRTLVIYQEGLTTYPVTVEEVTFFPHHETRVSNFSQHAFNGTALLKMKAVA